MKQKTKSVVLATIIILIELVEYSENWPDFYFYPRGGENNSSLLLSTNKATLNNVTSFDSRLPTVFIVHGFTDDHLVDSFQYLKDQLNEYTQVNVIMVDWKEGAAFSISFDINYDEATENTRIVGKSIAEYIKSNNIDPKTVTCIGHSLGAHCCGFAGKNVNNLGRISGIDPAGPKFKGRPPNERLDKSDALFVDCIFTTIALSVAEPICQANFYPNSLVDQPGCSILDIACQHSAGLWYYSSSVDYMTCRFHAQRCNSSDEFKRQQCKCDTHFDMCAQEMGYFANRNALGNFYLRTQKDRPYCLYKD